MAVASQSMQLPVPLMLLLNGGEETVLTAAHGFMQSSKWADQVMQGSMPSSSMQLRSAGIPHRHAGSIPPPDCC